MLKQCKKKNTVEQTPPQLLYIDHPPYCTSMCCRGEPFPFERVLFQVEVECRGAGSFPADPAGWAALMAVDSAG